MNDESTWEECIESNASLQGTPDRPKVTSLIDTAAGRVQFLTETGIKESNANYVFENYYSSVLELMHALVLLYGYKVGNHICLGYYLRDILQRHDLFRLFDGCRSKRNSLIYHGRKMDYETAKYAIEKAKQLIVELNKILDVALEKTDRPS
ncbi:MAG: hypothetical protein Q7R76_05735 [Candidatus Woesearchaeota archaeon]|nr:hypothetical protein [Candidatus Woesearchaeota archaeon]